MAHIKNVATFNGNSNSSIDDMLIKTKKNIRNKNIKNKITTSGLVHTHTALSTGIAKII